LLPQSSARVIKENSIVRMHPPHATAFKHLFIFLT
jgi:hypothetical protein